MATTRVSDGKHAQNLAKRFHQHGEAYFRFITTPGIEPTNNLAEQAIRYVVIDRWITQGTRSETGRRWCERIWTTIATCSQQGRSVFEFLLESVQANLCGAPPPSLMPSGPCRPLFPYVFPFLSVVFSLAATNPVNAHLSSMRWLRVAVGLLPSP